MEAMDARPGLGMKWYTSYVKVRPWLGAALFLLNVFVYGENLLIMMNIGIVGA